MIFLNEDCYLHVLCSCITKLNQNGPKITVVTKEFDMKSKRSPFTTLKPVFSVLTFCTSVSLNSHNSLNNWNFSEQFAVLESWLNKLSNDIQNSILKNFTKRLHLIERVTYTFVLQWCSKCFVLKNTFGFLYTFKHFD